MKKKRQVSLIKVTGTLLLISFIIGSCATGAPVRKKMPDYLQYDAFENDNPFQGKQRNVSAAEYKFTYNESEITGTDGKSQECISVPLQDATYDAFAISLFESYKVFAMPLLTEWAKQSRSTVVLDLRANTVQMGSRADYSLEKDGEFSIPVILLWDASSEARAATFARLLQTVPGVECRKAVNQ